MQEKNAAINAEILKLLMCTVGTIHDNKDKLSQVFKQATYLSDQTLIVQRSSEMLNIEQLLSVRINDQRRLNVPINSVLIQKKGKNLHTVILMYNLSWLLDIDLKLSRGFLFGTII